MSACALLVIGVLALSFARGRVGLRAVGLCARPALWREFLAHEYPRADQKGDAHNRRRGERGEILQHGGYLDLLASRGQPVAVPALALYPQAPASPVRRSPGREDQGNEAAGPHQEPRKPLQAEQHAGVSERVRLNPVQVEELGHAVIVRAEQLGVHFRRDRRPADFGETVTGEEGDGEGQHENARYAHRPGTVKQLIDDEVPDARAPPALINRDGAELRQVVPHNVQRAAPDNGPVSGRLGDGELKDVFVKVHRVLLEQPPRAHVLLDQLADFWYVPRARLPDYVLHRGTSVALNYNRPATPSIAATARMLRLATAPSLCDVGPPRPLPQSGQSARANGFIVIITQILLIRFATGWASD